MFLDVYNEDILIIIHPKNQTKKINPFFRQKQCVQFTVDIIQFKWRKAQDSVTRFECSNSGEIPFVMMIVERLVILPYGHIRIGHIWGNQLYIEVGCLQKYALRKLKVLFPPLGWR